jgi:hypothetical protein
MRDAPQAEGGTRVLRHTNCWTVVVHCTSQRTPCASIRTTDRYMS